MNRFGLGASCAIPFWLCATALHSTAPSEPDACKLLTPAQVGAAVGFTVGDGTHVTPTYVKTCTWTGTTSTEVKFVTLYLQSSQAYDGGKEMARQMAAGASGAAVKSASVGEDAYYFVTGDQVGLLVKKGGASFKVTVYAKLPVEKKEAMEATLAAEVVAKL